MQYQTGFQSFQPEAHDRLKIWNDILVQAAKDLATFTEYGIYARFISSLALKCEEYEGLKNQNKYTERLYILEKEIEAGIEHICRTAHKIWQEKPSKRRVYSRELDQKPLLYS